MKDQNILIVGVGGQGVLLASEILCLAALNAGFDTKKSEVHGMAQRGGVVSSHVRIGEKIHSPLIKEGHADIMLAFEAAEALRWIYFVKPDGKAVINDYHLVPPIASMKGFDYPENPIAKVKDKLADVQIVNAVKIAEELGNPRLLNTILIGVLSKSLNIPEKIWHDVIKSRVPKGTEDLNSQAFQKGREQL